MTHTFEIKINGFEVEGEVSFPWPGDPQITTSAPINLTLPKYKAIGKILTDYSVLCDCYGEIEKIEIVKKT